MKKTLMIMTALFSVAVCFAVPTLTVESVRIKTEKITPAVSNVLDLALADVWDWEHPGRLHMPPDGYSPTNDNARATFGRHVNTGWIVHTNGDLDGWSEYRVTDLQTDFRITPAWVNTTKNDLKQAGLNINKDIQIVQE